jgi:hypothetical protein
MTWDVTPPFVARSHSEVPGGECRSLHVLYPLANQKVTPFEETSSFCGLIWQRKVLDPRAPRDEEGMIFPFYFYRHTDDPSVSYQGVFPVGGEVKGHFGYQQISWALWPFYMSLEKNLGDERVCTPWPFVQWQRGEGTKGFALWPLFGNFSKENSYVHSYILWPLIYEHVDKLDQPIPRRQYGFLPFYAAETAKDYESRTYLWPFFGFTEKQNPFDRETRLFWPFFVQRHGPEHYINRWAPFYTYSCHEGREKNWILWPLIKRQYWEEHEHTFERNQILYFLLFHEVERRKAQPEFQAEKLHFWPFFSYWDNGEGRRQWQSLSPLEVFFPHNEVVRRVYGPLFALYQFEANDAAQSTRHRLLFGLIQHERTPVKASLKIGPLLETEDTPEGFRLDFLKGLLGFGQKNGRNYVKILGRCF